MRISRRDKFINTLISEKLRVKVTNLDAGYSLDTERMRIGGWGMERESWVEGSNEFPK